MNYRFLVYAEWRDYPEGAERPFKTVGRPAKTTDNYLKMINYLKKNKRKLLLIVKGEGGYENAISAEPEQLIRYMRSLTDDLGLCRK